MMTSAYPLSICPFNHHAYRGFTPIWIIPSSSYYVLRPYELLFSSLPLKGSLLWLV